MELIDIVKRLPWPDGHDGCERAGFAVQDCCGMVSYWSAAQQPQFEIVKAGEWHSKAGNCVHTDRSIVVSSDYATAIITNDDWLAAQEPEEPKEREPGFYWIRPSLDDEWAVWEYFDGGWWSAAYSSPIFDESRIAEVDERRIVRQQ